MKKNSSIKEGFRITRQSGFQIVFSNGYTVSVQFGYGNYGSNYDNTKLLPVLYNKGSSPRSKEPNIQVVESTTAEVAVLLNHSKRKKKGETHVNNFVTKKFVPEANDVLAYIKVDELMDLLNKVQKAKPTKAAIVEQI